MNRKGFTLIELLAVIIILGILMLIAIPSVTSYINNTRKQSYIDIVKNLINGSILKVNSGDLCVTCDEQYTYFIDPKCVKLETAYKSPYGNFGKSYVVVKYDDENDTFKYYWTGVDDAGMGINYIAPFDSLNDKKIKSNITADDIKVEPIKNGKYVVIDENCDCGTPTESDTYSSGKCYNPDDVVFHHRSTMDGVSFIFYGSLVIHDMQFEGLENCNIGYTKWKWKNEEQGISEYQPIEDFPHLISYDDHSLRYIVMEDNIRAEFRYLIHTDDD